MKSPCCSGSSVQSVAGCTCIHQSHSNQKNLWIEHKAGCGALLSTRRFGMGGSDGKQRKGGCDPGCRDSHLGNVFQRDKVAVLSARELHCIPVVVIVSVDRGQVRQWEGTHPIRDGHNVTQRFRYTSSGCAPRFIRKPSRIGLNATSSSASLLS